MSHPTPQAKKTEHSGLRICTVGSKNVQSTSVVLRDPIIALPTMPPCGKLLAIDFSTQHLAPKAGTEVKCAPHCSPTLDES